MAHAFEAARAAPRTQPLPTADGLLAGLTGEQQQAVRHGIGRLLIMAGPGTGKTHTLIHRIAWLLAEELAESWEILAVTFSVRAAGELRLRLSEMLGVELAGGVRAATFHSVCAQLLREHAELFGRTPEWTVYDQTEVRKTIEWLLSEHQRGQVGASVAATALPAANEIEREVSLAKNRLLAPAEYEQAAAHPAAEVIAGVWRELEGEMRRLNAFAFDDLLVLAVRLLAERPYVLRSLRERWRWLLVDEVQDTCRAQLELVSLLAGPGGSLTAVGDPDQVLYSFRGADARGMGRLADRFPGHARIALSRNRRSRAEIVSAAVRCVQHNPGRDPRALMAVRGAGGQVSAVAFGSERAEAEWVTGTVAGALRDGTAPGEVLILARTGFTTEPLQRELARAGIPHRVLGALGLYERSEVRDALAYLTLLANPRDARALARAVSTPRRGIGERSQSQIVAAARDRHDGDLIRACADERTAGQIRSIQAREKLRRFGAGLQAARDEVAAGRSLSHVTIAVITMPGGLVRWQEWLRDRADSASKRRDAERVLEDLRSLCRHVQAYEQHEDAATLTGFLEHAAGLHAEELADGEPDRRITASTIHRSKGMEARLVIVIGCEERLLPNWRALESADSERLEEERRLFYVACTRAKDQLHLTHAAMRNGRQTGGPSRFLTEAGLLETGR
jgi:DNA helicase-2/ATP-dependent DNA helicase PcrA